MLLQLYDIGYRCTVRVGSYSNNKVLMIYVRGATRVSERHRRGILQRREGERESSSVLYHTTTSRERIRVTRKDCPGVCKKVRDVKRAEKLISEKKREKNKRQNVNIKLINPIDQNITTKSLKGISRVPNSEATTITTVTAAS